MRVLMSSTGGFGHIQPMVPLALVLQERGHDVRWATAADGCERVAAAGIPTIEAGATVTEQRAEFRRRWPEASSLRGEDRPAFSFPKMFGAIYASSMLDGITRAIHEWKPDLVVNEAGEFAAPAVASAAGIPHVTHGFGLVVPKERVAAAAQEFEASAGLEPRPYGAMYDHLYIDIYPPSMQQEDLSHIGRIQRRKPASADAAPGELLPDAIAKGIRIGNRPTVYLTFGTIFNDNATFAAALSALVRFDATIVVTVGPDGDVDAFGEQPPNVHIARYIPQSLLFPHCSVVVSHAGSGTLLAALGLGLPQLCLPQGADQFRNGAACVAAGAGLSLGPDDATADAIERCVGRLLTDETFRTAARQIRDEIEVMPTVEDVAATLEKI